MKWNKIFLSFVLFLSIFSLPYRSKAAPKYMHVHFINVGQGDAIDMKAPNGEDILIDSGRNGNTVVSYLKKRKSMILKS